MSEKEKIVSLAGKRNNKAKEIKDEKNTQTENNQNTQELVYCSFCNRPNTQVVKMVQGPGVNICSECTMIAVQYLILEDKMPSAQAQAILDAFWNKAK